MVRASGTASDSDSAIVTGCTSGNVSSVASSSARTSTTAGARASAWPTHQDNGSGPNRLQGDDGLITLNAEADDNYSKKQAPREASAAAASDKCQFRSPPTYQKPKAVAVPEPVPDSVTVLEPTPRTESSAVPLPVSLPF